METADNVRKSMENDIIGLNYDLKGDLNFLAEFQDKNLEITFFQRTIRDILGFAKWIALFSGFLNLIFLLHDFFYIPEAELFYQTLILRTLYSVWTVVFFILVMRMKNVYILNKFKLFTEAYFIFTQILILYLLKFDNFDSHSLIILIIFIAYAIVSNDWLSYTISVILCTLIYFGTTVLYLTNYTEKEYITAGIYFFLAICVCSLVSYRYNSYLRSSFFEKVLKERIGLAEKERNRLLELEKQQVSELYEKEQIISKMNKMSFLRAQIKPHFINNALNTIELLCYEDPEKAGEMLQYLSDYLTYIYDFDEEIQFVPFEDELKLITAYVEIEKARFADRFDFSCNICDTKGLLIPVLILQPLVENAIKHGVGRKDKKDFVHLTVTKETDCYHICVEDNGIGIPKEKLKEIFQTGKSDKTGIGLRNIQRRLKELYNTGLEIETHINAGTKITIKIPRITGDNDESGLN